MVKDTKQKVFLWDLEQWAAKQGYVGKLTDMAKSLFKKAPAWITVTKWKEIMKRRIKRY